MMFSVLILLCASTQAIHTSKIVKRELLESLQITPPGNPAFEPSLRYPLPLVQPPTAYEYKEGYEAARGSNYVSVHKIQSPALGNIFGKGVAPSYQRQTIPPAYDVKGGFHPDFSINAKIAEPWNYQQYTNKPQVYTKRYDDNNNYFANRHHDNHFADGGRPDFNYETTGGVTGPQHEPYLRQNVLSVPVGHYDDHRLKQGYSPVHYRYNDDTPVGHASAECNRYHCPL